MAILKSIKGLFGQIIHYKDGVKVGETWDGLIPGTYNHYDENGTYAGHSDSGFFANKVHYDRHGQRIGETWTDDFGISRHYDDHGRAGTSYDGFASRITIMDDAQSSFDDDSYSDFSGDSFGDSSW